MNATVAAETIQSLKKFGAARFSAPASRRTRTTCFAASGSAVVLPLDDELKKYYPHSARYARSPYSTDGPATERRLRVRELCRSALPPVAMRRALVCAFCARSSA